MDNSKIDPITFAKHQAHWQKEQRKLVRNYLSGLITPDVFAAAAREGTKYQGAEELQRQINEAKKAITEISNTGLIPLRYFGPKENKDKPQDFQRGERKLSGNGKKAVLAHFRAEVKRLEEALEKIPGASKNARIVITLQAANAELWRAFQNKTKRERTKLLRDYLKSHDIEGKPDYTVQLLYDSVRKFVPESIKGAPIA